MTAPMPVMRSPVPAPPLPFVAPGAPAPRAALGETRPVPPISPAPRGAAPRVDFDQTITVSLAPVSAAMPFRPADPVAMKGDPRRAPGLTLEQYASLCVELDARPERVVETLARYHLSSEGRASLDALWKPRLAADAALFAAFGRAYTTYKASFVQARAERAPKTKGRS